MAGRRRRVPHTPAQRSLPRRSAGSFDTTAHRIIPGGSATLLPTGTVTFVTSVLRRRGISAAGARRLLAVVLVTSAADRVTPTDVAIPSLSAPSRRAGDACGGAPAGTACAPEGCPPDATRHIPEPAGVGRTAAWRIT